MSFRELLHKGCVLLDGGMGTMLCEKGLKAGELTESWNITHPEDVKNVHKAYFDAGSNTASSNTFGVNTLKYTYEEADRLIGAAFDILRAARDESSGTQEKYLALDIGPLGRILKPFGDLDFEDAVSAFADTVRLGVKHGAELIIIETFTDLYETKAALLAAKENSDLPVLVSNAYGSDGRLLTGASPEAVIAVLEAMGADAVGLNCSFGPDALLPVAETYLKTASVPVLFKPNAGLPVETENGSRYDVTPEDFAASVTCVMEKGARLAGGCCGTTPDYIKALAEKMRGIKPVEIIKKNETVIASYTHTVPFGGKPVVIGERINPTGKKRLKQAITEKDFPYILSEALAQEEKGAAVLDVNMGVPGTDEKENLTNAVRELQAVTSLPLQIDTSDPEAMEAALRRYNGKAMINSVNGKKESMERIFPLMKKYGGVAVALTLDENGIPETAEGRAAIAEKILSEAAFYGIDKKDIVFDALCLTVSADKTAARTTLDAVKLIRERTGCQTVLGVSNVSFGLPERTNINETFLALALENGLSAAIMNPCAPGMMKIIRSFNALNGYDENCAEYIAFCDTNAPSPAAAPVKTEENGSLKEAVIKGLRKKAAEAAETMLQTVPALEIISEQIMPALEEVGRGFENNTVYLPGLLMSAEAAKSAFDVIKSDMNAKHTAVEKKCPFVIATVKGDIHDIGKNIVKLLLENYGYDVTDLGKDVPPEEIADAVIRTGAPFAGLSALMTTTVPAMEATIKLLREKAPACKVIVGGAVLNESYAEKIGADKYAADAMATVRYVREEYGA